MVDVAYPAELLILLSERNLEAGRYEAALEAIKEHAERWMAQEAEGQVIEAASVYVRVIRDIARDTLAMSRPPSEEAAKEPK